MMVSHFNVYDLPETMVASGLPMQVQPPDPDFVFVDNAFDGQNQTRCNRLAATPPGSGHNNFLSGILVSANVEATVKWWTQFQRYHFAQIVSSMSTMHRLRQMLLEDTAVFHPKTSPVLIQELKKMAKDCTDDEELLYSCPMGLELTARITTNYLQLKTIYLQRKNHKLEEWRDFCTWIEVLPMSYWITKNGKDAK